MINFIKKIPTVLIFIIALVILYAPIIVIAILSFNDSLSTSTFTEFTFKWYPAIFDDKSLLVAITNSIWIALSATIISTIIGTYLAITINNLQPRFKRFVIFLNNIPILNPDIVSGISLMIVFSALGISFGRYSMLIAHVFFCIPFVVLSVLPRLKQIDNNTYDAARDLGCSHFSAITKVVVPAIKTGIISGALIAFTMSIDDFVISYFTTGDGFANFSTWIYSRIGRRNFSPSAYAYNTLITVGILIVLLYVNLTSKGEQNNEKNN